MGAKYQPYPEYKDSGVEVIGDVPKSWVVGRLKQIVDQNRQITYGIVQAGPNKKGGIPYIRPADMTDEGGVKDYDGLLRTSPEIAADYERSKIKPGDIVCSIGPSFGKLMITPETLDGANLTQGTARVAISSAYNARYFFWALRATSSFQQWESSVGGATFRALNLGPLADTFVVVPSNSEQEKIANFLDHETAKIDSLIEKQQQLIKLLKEKRQAVISHAVTKGLNPNAPMRDSGVEWLGEVPEHWVPMQIRRILPDMEQGKSPECESREAENNEWGVLKTSCVNRAIYNSEANKALPSTVEPFPQYEVKKGDVLMSRASGSRDLIGSVAYVYETRPQILLSDKVFRLHLSSRVNRIFFSFLMQSSYMRSNIERAISGAEGMANNITKSAVIGFSFALPPEGEQDEIAETVTKKLDVFDGLIIKAESAIKIMQERRTALISSAVTGKIDVRNWQAPERSDNQSKEVAA